MTREDAKIFLYSVAGNLGFIDIENYTCKDGEKMREAIKALDQEPETVTEFADRCRECGARYGKLLKQEPCEDAISRQEVLDIVDSYSESQSNVEDVTQDIISDILALPPVNPQPKTGHWIKSNVPNEEYVCSECGGGCWYYDYQADVSKSMYCPNCGACMKDCRTLDEFIEDSKESEG